MSRNLLIILRTCVRDAELKDAKQNDRYIKSTRLDLVNHCVSSLVHSINQVQGHTVKLVVLDDHSIDQTVIDLKNILSKCKYPTEFISVEDGSGNGHTMSKVYEQVEKRANDLWYHVEDDYLHFPEAIQDMIDTVDQFESNTGQLVAINPHDDIWRYTKQIYESFILLGPYRHYRTVQHTTYTCFASKTLYNKYQKTFQDLVQLTINKEGWVEDRTINQIWQQPDVMLFSPIPGLGFHVMDESGKDPYVDIMKLWNSIPKLWSQEIQ